MQALPASGTISDMRNVRTETYDHTISGLLGKRSELMQEIAALREQMAVASNAVEAIDQVLETFGHTEDLEGRTPRAARIVLFYRNELRTFLLNELRNSPEPMTSRQLAIRICETEGKSIADRRLLNDVTRRVGCALRKLRAVKAVEGWRGKDGSAAWQVLR